MDVSKNFLVIIKQLFCLVIRGVLFGRISYRVAGVVEEVGKNAWATVDICCCTSILTCSCP